MGTSGPAGLWRWPCAEAPGELPTPLLYMSAKLLIHSSDLDDISLLWLSWHSGFNILFLGGTRQDWGPRGYRVGHSWLISSGSSSLEQALRLSLGKRRTWRQLSWHRLPFCTSCCSMLPASSGSYTIRAHGRADSRSWPCAEPLWSWQAVCRAKRKPSSENIWERFALFRRS